MKNRPVADRHERIRKQLNHAQTHGVIRRYDSQSAMPGRVWRIELYQGMSRTFITFEVEAFLVGSDAGLKAPTTQAEADV